MTLPFALCFLITVAAPAQSKPDPDLQQRLTIIRDAAYEAFTTGQALDSRLASSLVLRENPSLSEEDRARVKTTAFFVRQVHDLQMPPSSTEPERQKTIRLILALSDASRSQNLPHSETLPKTEEVERWEPVYQSYVTGRRNSSGASDARALAAMTAEQQTRFNAGAAMGLSRAQSAARVNADIFTRPQPVARTAALAGPGAAQARNGMEARNLPERQIPANFLKSPSSPPPPAAKASAPPSTPPDFWAETQALVKQCGSWSGCMRELNRQYSDDQDNIVNPAMKRLAHTRAADCANALSGSCIKNTATMGVGVFKTFLNEKGKALTASDKPAEQVKALGTFWWENTGFGGGFESVKRVNGQVEKNGFGAMLHYYANNKLEAILLIGALAPGGKIMGKAAHKVDTALRDVKTGERAVEETAQATTHSALANPLNATSHGLTPSLTVTKGNGEIISGTLLGVDPQTNAAILRRSDGTYVHIEPGEPITKVERNADVWIDGNPRSIPTVLHDRPPIVEPYRDLDAYKGQKVDIHVHDVEDPRHQLTMSGTVVKTDPKTRTITLKGPDGEYEVAGEFWKIEQVDRDVIPAAFSSKGAVGHSLEINNHVPNGTPVQLSLPKNGKAEGIFRGVQSDAEGPYAVLEGPDGVMRGYRDFELRTTAPSRGTSTTVTIFQAAAGN